MNKLINECQIGEEFDNLLLIKNSSKGTATNGQSFLSLTLGDTSGTIDAKKWSSTTQDHEELTNGKIVKVKGTIGEFRNARQLNLLEIEVVEGHSPFDFMEKAPFTKEDMERKIDQTIALIKNDDIRTIVNVFLQQYHYEFYTYPAAASMHHAFISGLAYHTVTMLTVARQIAPIYHEINTDILFAGIILHDIGKIHEFTSESDATYTTEGKLLGHIPIMVCEIEKVADDLGASKEVKTILQHMVLSHHGIPEWGSARTPLMREAEMLHMIDNMDAKMNMLKKPLDETKDGAFTDKLYGFGNRSFYKPTI